MKNLIFFILTALLFSSCRTNLLFISVQKPAKVTMSNNVTKVGVINRSIPNEEDKIQNAAHQVLAAQSFAMLKEGGKEGIRGLKDALMENKRFGQVLVLDSIKLKSAAIGIFPSALSWDKVESICKTNKIDALFVLEMFDTDLKVNPSSVPVNVTSPMQVVNSIQNISMTTTVKTGWRIYVPSSRNMIDEYTVFQNATSSSGANPLITVDAILQRKEVIKKMAYDCGRIYSERILSEWVRVNRNYFIRGGTYEFKIAKRKARAGNWDGAAEIWKKNTTSSKRKTAGRANYNMAIIQEINGNLDEAIKYAQKSYEDYGVRLALQYINILKRRKNQENLLEIQNGQ